MKTFRKIFNGIEGKKILDIGCGTGTLASMLAEKNEVFGIDICEKAVEMAKRRNVKAMLGDAEKKLKFKKDFFDIVICKDVFEHLKFPEKTLKEISRVLKKEGLLFAHVPNEFNIIARAKILFGKDLVNKRWFKNAEQWNYPHIRFFTKKGFRYFLEKHGFEIERDYSKEWCYLGLKPLSMISTNLFSPGITFLARNKKRR